MLDPVAYLLIGDVSCIACILRWRSAVTVQTDTLYVDYNYL